MFCSIEFAMNGYNIILIIIKYFRIFDPICKGVKKVPCEDLSDLPYNSFTLSIYNQGQIVIDIGTIFHIKL